MEPYGPRLAGASLSLLRARYEPLFGGLSVKVLDVLLSEPFELQWVHLSSFGRIRWTKAMDKGVEAHRAAYLLRRRGVLFLSLGAHVR